MPLYLIDASIFIFKAWFSLPDSLTDAHGRPVNAAQGYAGFLLRLLRERRPQRIAVAFDESLTSSFRNEIYPPYKANRELPPPELEHQFALCREFTRAIGIAEFASDTYEADDIIATLAVRARVQEEAVIIVSRDKDLAQLIGPCDRLWDGAGEMQDQFALRARFGVHTTQLCDYQGLVGDAVDNIPGVPGVGPKAAAALLQACAHLEAIYADLDTVETLKVRGAKRLRGLLEAHREAAFLSRELATLHTGVPIGAGPDQLDWRGPDRAACAQALDGLGAGRRLRTLVAELPGSGAGG